MRKIVSIFLLLLLLTVCYAFDFNKDNFSVSTDIEEEVVVFNKTIYHIATYEETPKILSKIDRPEHLIDKDGYVHFILPTIDCFVFDINGHLVITQKFDNDPDISESYGHPVINEIIASSELTERSNGKLVTYKAKYPLLRLTAEKEIGFYIYYYGYPWVPNVKNDPNPFIEIKLGEPEKYIEIMPGYIDFKKRNLFKDNSRIKTIEIVDIETNKSEGTYIIEDKVSYTKIELPNPIKNIRIRLIDYYDGNKYRDPCIASIVFGNSWGKDAGDYGKKEIDYLLKMKAIM
jgi:hypothetical protein